MAAEITKWSQTPTALHGSHSLVKISGDQHQTKQLITVRKQVIKEVFIVTLALLLTLSYMILDPEHLLGQIIQEQEQGGTSDFLFPVNLYFGRLLINKNGSAVAF